MRKRDLLEDVLDQTEADRLLEEVIDFVSLWLQEKAAEYHISDYQGWVDSVAEDWNIEMGKAP